MHQDMRQQARCCSRAGSRPCVVIRVKNCMESATPPWLSLTYLRESLNRDMTTGRSDMAAQQVVGRGTMPLIER